MKAHIVRMLPAVILGCLAGFLAGCSEKALAPEVVLEGGLDSLAPFDRAAHAVANGDLEFVKSCVQSDPQYVTAINGRERTLLHYAAAANQKDIAEYLLQNGAWASATDDEGFTPDQIATQEGAAAGLVSLLKEASERELAAQQ